MNDPPLDRQRIAIGIRQPWAELILRGIKTVEIRSTGTKQRGTIYVYASKRPSVNSLAQAALRRHDLDLESLPRGMLIGTVDLVGSGPAVEEDEADACVPADYLDGRFAWRLKNPVRWEEPVRPQFLPYGVWFYPFRRRNASEESS